MIIPWRKYLKENTLLTVVMPFILSIVINGCMIVTMSEPWGSRRQFKCQNDEFWRSRAKLSRDSKVNFTNVADLEEEKKLEK